jgi:hypothetical protein
LALSITKRQSLELDQSKGKKTLSSLKSTLRPEAHSSLSLLSNSLGGSWKGTRPSETLETQQSRLGARETLDISLLPEWTQKSLGPL